MPVVSVGPDYLDDEVFALIRLLNRGGWMPHEVAMIERATQRRSEEVRAGLASYTSRYWTAKIQSELDDRTRLRWDYKNGWTLDRWAEGRWQVAGVFGFNNIRSFLIEYLKENDMQRWATPEAYLEYKRNKAMNKRFENWAASVKQLDTIIDGMSNKQVKDFIQTERAMQTGETITMHGPTKRMFDRMAKVSKRSPMIPVGRSINPGMHPFKYKRRTGGKHVKEA